MRILPVRSVLIFAALILSQGIAHAQSANPREEAGKLQPGTYYWSGPSWQPMQQITMSGSGAKHVGKMFVPGLTPQMFWMFRDARAPVQVIESRPVFCVKSIDLPPGTPYAPSARDLLIARFDEKKDHRELQTTSGASMFTFKSGISKERVVETSITELGPNLFLVTMKEPLSQGEYLLAGTSMAVSGYDFGFHPQKK
jgi:hypothetical protein